MKKLLLIISACIIGVSAFAQGVDEVTLVVSADGATKQEATQNALRSAIEQTYGTFVSANTSLLNDALVKDEIVTVASGNIKSFSEISSIERNGGYFVTLKATVSATKLVSFAQSKGATTEFAGSSFMANVKLQELYKKNEETVLENLLAQLKEIIPTMYDRDLEIGQPRYPTENDKSIFSQWGFWSNRPYPKIYELYSEMINGDDIIVVPMTITMKENNNALRFWDVLLSTMYAIQLTQEEIQFYKSSNIPYLYWKMNYGLSAIDMIHCEALNADFNPYLMRFATEDRALLDIVNLGTDFWQKLGISDDAKDIVYIDFNSCESYSYSYNNILRYINTNENFSAYKCAEFDDINCSVAIAKNEPYYSTLLQTYLDTDRLRNCGFVVRDKKSPLYRIYGGGLSLYTLIRVTERRIASLEEYNATHKRQKQDEIVNELAEIIKQSKIKEIFAYSNEYKIHERGAWRFNNGYCWPLRSDEAKIQQFEDALMDIFVSEWHSFNIKDNCGGVSSICKEMYYDYDSGILIFKGTGILYPCTPVTRDSGKDLFYKHSEKFSFNAFIKASDINKYSSFIIE